MKTTIGITPEQRIRQLTSELEDLLENRIPCWLLPAEDARRIMQLRANGIFFEIVSLRAEYGIKWQPTNKEDLEALLQEGVIPIAIRV